MRIGIGLPNQVRDVRPAGIPKWAVLAEQAGFSSLSTVGRIAYPGVTDTVALAGAAGLSAITSLVALGSFLVGALVSGYLGARHAEHRGRLLRAASITQFTLILVALIVALAVGEPLSSGTRYALLVPLALAMGVQNAAAQRLAVPELTTTVLTRTLTGLASEAGFIGGPGSKFGRRAIAVTAMLLGAVAGALLVLKVSIAAALAVAAAIVLAVALVAHALSRTDAPWAKP